MKDVIQELLTLFGPSGFEGQVREAIVRHVEPLADKTHADAMGNLYALKRGDGGGRRIMLAAHMDEIGMIVTQIEDEGFLRFSNLGALPPKTLLGQHVRFANGTMGVISLNGGLKVEIMGTDLPDPAQWYIDVGASGRADLPVGIGDVAVFERPFLDLGKRLVGGGFDDRLGCAILIEVMRRLESTPHDILFTFTVQEELGVRGARVAAFGQEPEIGIAVDVTPAGDTPKPKAPIAVKLGAGPAIKVADKGMVAHPHLRRAMEAAAEKHGIPYQLEVLTVGSTDAMAIQASRSGVIAGAISVPCRYVHTPAEMVDAADVEDTVRLLTAMLSEQLSGL